MYSVVSSGIIDVAETSPPMTKLSLSVVTILSVVDMYDVSVDTFHHIDVFSAVKFSVMTVVGSGMSVESNGIFVLGISYITLTLKVR